MSERTCAQCGRASTEVQFKKDKRNKTDGLGAYCLPCQRDYNRDYYQQNKRRLNAENAARYQANREAYLEQQKQYRLANIDRVRAKDRVRSRGNPVKIERSRQWKIENQGRYRELLRAWYRDNKDRAQHLGAVRRMRMLGNDGKVLRINRREIWLRDNGICGICKDPVPFEEMQIDHVVPLARGGSHVPGNVQPSHESCNRKKWANLPA